MSSTRSFLLFALAFVGFLIWQAWEQDYGTPPQRPAASAPAETKGVNTGAAEVPAAIGSAQALVPAAPASAPPAETAPTPRIEVRTDVLRVTIDTRGGALVQADLLGYPVDPARKEQPVRLLDDANATFFVAQSGLVSAVAPAPDHQAVFSADKTSYALAGADQIEVPLTWSDPTGIKVRKVYIFTRASYLIESRTEIENAGSTNWTGNAYRQLQRVPPIIPGGGFTFNNPERYAFAGAAWYSPQDKFKKLPFDKYATDALCSSNEADPKALKRCTISGGWVGMLQHYFFAAWIPVAASADIYQYGTSSDAQGNKRYLIRTLSPALTVAPGQSGEFAAHIYVGPTLADQLGAIEKAGVAQGLGLTADYGLLTPIAEPMHWILVKLHALVGNWGLAIILLVLLIKAALFKLSEAQFRSMAKMKRLQPRLEALKERYGDDKQKYNAAMMELWQKEKVNPMGGCLPTLVQIPVFFALYYVLLESVELRQAPFFGWIQNLSAPDPWYVLPIINGAVMLGAQFLSPTSPGMDPLQARMMKTMPLIFAVLFLFFPSGLVLYYAVNGGLGLLQQWIITRRLQAAEARAR
jgi:YidC/Oxa1 family membrane protein insertase